MKCTLEMHLVVGIQPVLIADVLFESVALLWERNALYRKVLLENSGREEHSLTNITFISHMHIQCVCFILFSSRLPYLLPIDHIYHLYLFS